MENGKWKMENDEKMADRLPLGFRFSFSKTCAACGAENRRETARFCDVCGKLLAEEYEPLDNLRASYGLQGKSFDLRVENEKTDEDLFEQNKNPVAETAWACFVYSLVPYLGILFVPLTFGISGLGCLHAVRKPHSGGKQLSLISFFLSFVVLAIQLVLWRLLYFVPKIPAF